MRRIRSRSARLIGLLMVLVSMAIVAQPLGVSAQTTMGQTTSSQTAGTATVRFSDVWQYDTEASDPDTAFLTHLDLPGTAFIYGEITDPIANADEALAQFTAGFFGEFGDGNHTVVDSGVVPTETVWQLFSVTLDSVPFGIFASANVTDIPGEVIIIVLMSPAGSFDLAATSAQDGVSVNGSGTSLSSFDPVALATTLEGGAVVGGSTPAAASTPAGDTDCGDLTLPPIGQPTPVTQQEPVQLTESVTVNMARIGYGGVWIYSADTSTPDQIAFFFNDLNPATIFGYATVADTTGDIATSLAKFHDGFFGSFDATNVVEVTSEVLPSGRAYTLNTGDRAGVPYAILTYADGTTMPGQFRAQVLITPLANFDSAFASVQQSFQIDSVGAMAELDAGQLSTLLGAGGQTPTTATTTPQAGGRGIAEFQAADAQDSCDGIGWVATSPDQLPVTEADANYRATCVGGAAFFANCGTAMGSAFLAPEPGMTWVRCDITVRVDGSPIELLMLDYSLVDAAGTSHPIDIFALVSMDSYLEFPEGQVATGQTAQGSVVFPCHRTPQVHG